MSQIENEKIEYVRDACPGSYIFKIQSFSLLSEFVKISDDIKCFESPEFESNGHKWKLSIYPNGNENVGVDDHISMYLAATDVDINSTGFGINNVTFKMFVYNHLCDNFMTVQDNAVKRFYSLKSEWGFARLISLERFKDAKNGYLLNDCCVFGVEIFVIPSDNKSGNVLMIKEPNDGTFTWKLDNFSTLDSVQIKDFEAQGLGWNLEIYPNGNSSGSGTHLSMFLKPNGSRGKLYLRCILRVKGQVYGKHHEKTITRCFDEPYLNWGFSQFISLRDLEDKSKGFILNDSLIAEVEIIFMTK